MGNQCGAGGPARTRVLCVDDSPDMNFILRRVIEQDPALVCVGCLESADAMVQAIATDGARPEVVVMDATMNGREPLEAMAELAARYPEVRTIVFSGHKDREFVQRVRGAGAWGCVSKDQEPGAIVHAVHDVAAGRQSWPQRSGNE